MTAGEFADGRACLSQSATTCCNWRVEDLVKPQFTDVSDWKQDRESRVRGEHRQQERQVTKFSLPSVQPANHEVAVVTHRHIQAKFLQFSFLGGVWQDQVGVIDCAWIEPPVLMPR